ncbi:hypothetical protein [Methylobacterium oryzae]|uniref:hypothetical protein n=1 Tax=Methylobacterium oryzae TaxID=334852 RepID=UPI001F32393A|nr:hypothetical protein [Methylobacterium oryzae]UIN38391.1 hypothetical protein LXM90_30885 [Methylobacterium oryzae]
MLKKLVLGGIALAALAGAAVPASASWQGPAGNAWFNNDVRPQGYNYAPSIINTGGTTDVWWCGQGATDVIYHRTATGAGFGPIQQVLFPRQAWNSAYTCDPSVIRGNFTNPQDGQHYTHIMYYSGANNLPGNNNQLGLAYSNDGINWVDWQGDSILKPIGDASNNYGLGQPSTFNADGQSSLFVFTTDTSVPADPNFAQIFVRHTPNGVNFEAPVRLPARATDGTSIGPNSDFGYDYNTGDVYMMSSLPGRNCNAEPCKDKVNNPDRETYQMGLYKMPISQVLSGQPFQWTPLGQLNTDQTGFYLNHSPGFNRDPSGNITPFFPNIQIFFAGGDPSPTTWKLTFSILNKDDPFAPLVRYYNGQVHKVTSGYAGPGFNAEFQLGRGLVAATAATHKLYSCFTGADYFLSNDAGCEGQQHLGVTAEVFNNQEANTHAIYRCWAGNHHFASNDPGCEGTTTEGPLGYIYNN